MTPNFPYSSAVTFFLYYCAYKHIAGGNDDRTVQCRLGRSAALRADSHSVILHRRKEEVHGQVCRREVSRSEGQWQDVRDCDRDSTTPSTKCRSVRPATAAHASRSEAGSLSEEEQGHESHATGEVLPAPFLTRHSPGFLLAILFRYDLAQYENVTITKTSERSAHDAESANAKLLVQGGFVHQEMAGVYTWLPLGLSSFAKSSRNNSARDGRSWRAGNHDAGASAERTVDYD